MKLVYVSIDIEDRNYLRYSLHIGPYSRPEIFINFSFYDQKTFLSRIDQVIDGIGYCLDEILNYHRDDHILKYILIDEEGPRKYHIRLESSGISINETADCPITQVLRNLYSGLKMREKILLWLKPKLLELIDL